MRAADLDGVDVLEPTVTPPMTKLFQQLVDRPSAHILLAQAQQKHYEIKSEGNWKLNKGMR